MKTFYLAVAVCCINLLHISCLRRDDREQWFDEFEAHVLPEALATFPFKHGKDLKDGQELAIYFPAAVKSLGAAGIYVLEDYALKRDEYQRVKQQIIGKAMHVGTLFDSCLLPIRTESNINSSCDGLYYPVPDTASLYYPKGSPFFPRNFDSLTCSFVVTDVQPGPFLKGDCLNGSINLIDPYKDGYSCGAILDDSRLKIIYWLVIW
jgi:hypothetical protein